MSEKAMFYCFVFAFGSYFGTGYMAIVHGVASVVIVKLLNYLYKNIDNVYLFFLALIPFIITLKITSPIIYTNACSVTGFYAFFILFAIFKGKTSADTKHFTINEIYLSLRDEAFKQKQQ